jgi:hypothetical protein
MKKKIKNKLFEMFLNDNLTSSELMKYSSEKSLNENDLETILEDSVENEFDDNLLVEVTAYHGSAYNFDKFDVAFIGKGEHGQAHGWGLYFSFGKDIAQGYRSRISSMNSGNQFEVFTYKGKSYERGTVMFTLLQMLVLNGKKDAISKIDRILKNKEYMDAKPNVEKWLLDTKKKFEKMKDGELKAKPIKEEGNFYTVKLPEFKYYLDEGSTFSEQTDYVQKCLKKLYKEKKIKAVKDYIDNSSYRARGFYNTLDAVTGSPKKASLLLNDYGIAGIRYDGNIDKGCAVIFNNKDITIVSKATNVDKDEPLLPEDMAVEENPELIKNYPNPSKKIQMLAVTTDKTAIQYIENPDPEVIEYVLGDNPNNIQYLKNPSFDLIKKYLDKLSVYVISALLKNINDDSEKEYLIIESIKKVPENFVFFDNRRILTNDLLKKSLAYMKENLDLETVANIFSNLSEKRTVEELKIYNDYFYFDLPYDKLDDHKKAINYSITNEYRIEYNLLNEMPLELKNNILSWEWEIALPYLDEFGNNELNIFKKICKFGYVNKGNKWNEINLGSKTKMSPVILQRLLNYIGSIKKEGININYRELYRYMDIKELYKLYEEKGTIDGIYNNLYNDSGNTSRNDFILYIIENKIKTLNDINTPAGKDIIKNARDVLSSILYNEPEKIANDDILFALTLKMAYMQYNKYDLNRMRDILENASVNIQKFILSLNFELLRFVNNVDIRIQNKLIERNPYNIRFINNPDKSVIDKAIKMNPNVSDYIRN